MDRTGVGRSAADRAATFNALADPSVGAEAFCRPGHVFPLRSKPGGCRERDGHTEAALDVCALAGCKPAGVLGVSVGATGSSLAQQHLRNVLAYLDVPTMGQPEAFIQAKEGFFAADGSIGNPDSQKFLQTWVDRYVAWIRQHLA